MIEKDIKTVIEGNSFYEIDVKCMQEKAQQKDRKTEHTGLRSPIKKRQRN